MIAHSPPPGLAPERVAEALSTSVVLRGVRARLLPDTVSQIGAALDRMIAWADEQDRARVGR